MIEIRLAGLDELAEFAKAQPVRYLSVLDKLARRSATELARIAKRTAPQLDGGLVQSLTSDRVTLGVWVARTGVQYAQAIEEGIKPGSWVPYQSMLAFVKRKRLLPRNPSDTQETLAKLLQRSVFARGIRANPFMQRAATEGAPRVEKIFNAGIANAVNE